MQTTRTIQFNRRVRLKLGVVAVILIATVIVALAVANISPETTYTPAASAAQRVGSGSRDDGALTLSAASAGTTERAAVRAALRERDCAAFGHATNACHAPSTTAERVLEPFGGSRRQ
jgi:hypothetical protein